MGDTIRVEDDGAVRHVVLCRPDEFNTITLTLRNELDTVLDEADADNGVRVALVRAEGKAFCAGFGLDWSTVAEATATTGPGAACGGQRGRRPHDRAVRQHLRQAAFDLEADARLVQGWCIAGGHRHDPERGHDRSRRVGPVSAIRPPGCGACPRPRGSGSPGSASNGPSAICSPATS